MTNLVKNILQGQPHLAIALNTHPQKNSDSSLREAVVQLRVTGLLLQNIDPYEIERKMPEVNKTKVMNVRLNSTNYVSEKQKQIWETSLQTVSQVNLPTHQKQFTEISSEISLPSTPTPTPTSTPINLPTLSSQPSEVNPEKVLALTTAVNSDLKLLNHGQSDNSDIPADNYQQIIESLENTITEFSRHQHDVLNIHEKSLQHQTEYTKTFLQLMQQQYAIWGNSQFTESQSQTQQLAISSSERSMMRFHDHQSDTLRIHQQYLNYQHEYTNNIFQLLQQNYQGQSSVVTGERIENLPPVTQHNHGKNHQLQDLILPKDNSSSTITVTSLKNQDQHSPPPPHPPTSPSPHLPTSPPPSRPLDLSHIFLTIVSDKTGYPVEMLELSMDMEADLGIDSIKRVEILGALLELHPDLPKPNPEELTQLHTLGEILAYMQTLVSTELIVENQVELFKEDKQEVLNSSTANFPDPIPNSEIPLDLSNILMTVVSDKTGYPVEMLELSMDMEADLGIDSIKRVEILGALLELYPDLPKPNPEALAELRTLGQIIDYMQQQAEVHQTKNLSGETEDVLFHANSEVEINNQIQRRPVRLKLLPKPDYLDFTFPSECIAVVTDDGSSTTRELALALAQKGWKTVVLNFPANLVSEQSPLPAGIDRVVLADLTEAHLEQQLAAIANNYGAIATFIHLHPHSHSLHHPLHDESRENVLYLESEKSILRHVFLIAKYLKASLNQTAAKGRSAFLTVAHLDGQFGLGDNPNFGVVSAGFFGLTKSLNWEWESVFCRSLDLSPDLASSEQVQHILAELHDPNLLVTEVGYTSQTRVTLVAETSSTEITTSTPVLNNQVFLVSGGGKGITAQCVIKLAERYQGKFILLGRSSTEPEPVWAEGCDDEAALKQRIMEDFFAKGEKPTPIMVQKRFKAIASQREIQATLQAIAAAGAEAEYISVDVTDAIALSEQVNQVVERWGAITGIIHGAGNLADKRIENKTIQDFETVYGAKVKGLENLLHCVPPEQLQYLVLFSSVVGFYGNAGQSDYAIANEILNKSALMVKRKHPQCQVLSINWGPWDSGMVSPELKKAFAERHIKTIPISLGTEMLADELAITNSEVVQVVIGSPLIYIPRTLPSELKTYHIQRQLRLSHNPFLEDHVIAGRPVLPATCALTWIANTCEQLYPGYTVFACPNYKVLKGVIFDENLPSEYNLDLQEVSKIENEEIELEAKIWSQNSAGKIRYHFSSQVKLKREIRGELLYESINLNQDQHLVKTTSFYQNGIGSLFHGQTFQGVKSFLNASPGKVTIECYLPNPGEKQQGQFNVQTFNPYIADVQIHSLWIWTQHFHQEVCLPSEIKLFEQLRVIPFDEIFYVSCEVKSKTESSVVADIIAHDAEGKIYNRMIGAKGTIIPKAREN